MSVTKFEIEGTAAEKVLVVKECKLLFTELSTSLGFPVQHSKENANEANIHPAIPASAKPFVEATVRSHVFESA